MVGNKALKIKGTRMLRKVKKLTSDPCTDQQGKQMPLSKTVIVIKMQSEAQHPWSHRTEQSRGQEDGPAGCPTAVPNSPE